MRHPWRNQTAFYDLERWGRYYRHHIFIRYKDCYYGDRGGILYIHINKSGLSTKIFFQNKGQKSKEIRVDILMYCIVGISKRFRQA